MEKAKQVVPDLSEERLQLLARAILGAADTARIGLTVVYTDGDQPEYAYISPVNADILGIRSFGAFHISAPSSERLSMRDKPCAKQQKWPTTKSAIMRVF